MVLPDYEIIFQIYFYLENFFSYKILAKKCKEFFNELKELNENTSLIEIKDIIKIVKNSKNFISLKEELANDDNHAKVYYNDQEFNQDNDVKCDEIAAVIDGIRLYFKEKIKYTKFNSKNVKKTKETFESILSKYFNFSSNVQSSNINKGTSTNISQQNIQKLLKSPKYNLLLNF